MLHIDLPTQAEIAALVGLRAQPSVSIYLRTTPLTQDAQADRVELKNLLREASRQIEALEDGKRLAQPIVEAVEDLIDDDDFWAHQANSLAVFVTAEQISTFRLPNHLESTVQVADRFHVKPLLRAVTFPHSAYVLVLAEGGVRLVELSPNLPPNPVRVPDLPRDAADAVGKASINDRAPIRRIQGSEGKKVRLAQYARVIDRRLRAVLAGHERPLILAGADPLASIFRRLNSYPHLASEGISGNAERLGDTELAKEARAILDRIHAERLATVVATFATRRDQGRATTDVSQTARAATFGAIDTLIVDMDEVIPGRVDEADGSVELADEASASSYGVVDEIVGRAFESGARVMAARREDIPEQASLAAILRYPI